MYVMTRAAYRESLLEEIAVASFLQNNFPGKAYLADFKQFQGEPDILFVYINHEKRKVESYHIAVTHLTFKNNHNGKNKSGGPSDYITDKILVPESNFFMNTKFPSLERDFFSLENMWNTIKQGKKYSYARKEFVKSYGALNGTYYPKKISKELEIRKNELSNLINNEGYEYEKTPAFLFFSTGKSKYRRKTRMYTNIMDYIKKMNDSLECIIMYLYFRNDPSISLVYSSESNALFNSLEQVSNEPWFA